MSSFQLNLLFEPILKKFKQRKPVALLSNDDLQKKWIELATNYFPQYAELAIFSVRWSDRQQKRSLASCNPIKQRVHVARALAHPHCTDILEPLLYHEMCHAVLGAPQRINGRYSYHGKEFKALEKRHPGIPHLNNWIKTGGWANAKRTYTRMTNSTYVQKR